MSEREEQASSVYGRMIAGSAWALAMRWSVRLIGLASVVILARLLTPRDFGIAAMGAIVIALIEGFTELGTALLLLREREVTRADCDTAWTVRMLQGVLVALILIAGAPLAASYFSEPAVEPVLWVLACMAIVSGCENIGMVLVRRDLDFAKDFRFGLYHKLASFLATLILAIVYRSYWALVLGQLAGAITACVISYAMHPYRPRLSLAKARRYVTFSLSIVALNLGFFLRDRTGTLVIGGMGSAAVLGAFNVAAELAAMATREIVIPVWRGLFPSFAKLRDEPERLRIAYRHLLSTIGIICLPLGLGMWFVAGDLVATLLGPQWASAVPLLEWLAISSTLMCLTQILGGNILIVTGHERLSACIMWFHLCVMVPLVVLGGRLWGAEGVAAMTTLAAALALPAAAEGLRRAMQFTWSNVLQALWRPLAAVGAMLAILEIIGVPDAWPAPLRLVGLAVLGGAVYCTVLGVLWLLAGRPSGPEASLSQWLFRSRARRFIA